MPTEQPPAGEYVCSNGACRRRWTHDGGALPHVPVLDLFSAAPGLRWHPCPDCDRTVPAFADLAHRLRSRTADELLRWGPAPGADAGTQAAGQDQPKVNT